ncbi:MAG: helix-turn-helix transcriptional regulator [Halobacteriota archaeon]|nr:helix-turn-helix transcriptional regulator [Halobacteriota archaeon]
MQDKYEVTTRDGRITIADRESGDLAYMAEKNSGDDEREAYVLAASASIMTQIAEILELDVETVLRKFHTKEVAQFVRPDYHLSPENLFAPELRRLREEHGYTSKEYASEISMDMQEYLEYESGQTLPDTEEDLAMITFPMDLPFEDHQRLLMLIGKSR